MIVLSIIYKVESRNLRAERVSGYPNQKGVDIFGPSNEYVSGSYCLGQTELQTCMFDG